MVGDSETYTDFLIAIRAGRDAGYEVESEIDRDQFYYGGKLELDPVALTAQFNNETAYRAALTSAVFTEGVRRGYAAAVSRARERSGGALRVRLELPEDAPELQDVWWERLGYPTSAGAAPLAIDGLRPFSRTYRLESGTMPALTTRPVRLSICMANPTGLPAGFAPLDVEGETRNLLESLQSNLTDFDITLCAGRTPLSDDLKQAIARCRVRLVEGSMTADLLVDQMGRADLLHFFGHGTMFRGVASLYLEGPAGTLAVARDQEWIARLTGSKVPRLIVLASCQTAVTESGHAFTSLAGKLVKQSIPAVLAMQALLPLDDVGPLTRAFYSTLLETGRVDVAANAARSALFNNKSADYSIPALITRLADGQLLEADPARQALDRLIEQLKDSAATQTPLPVDVAISTGALSRAQLESLAAGDQPGAGMLEASLAAFSDDAPGRIVVIAGPHGSSKTTHLAHVALETATQSLASGARLLPLLIDASRIASRPDASGDSFAALAQVALDGLWPGMKLAQLLEPTAGYTLRLLVDADVNLTGAQLTALFSGLASFARQHAQHQYFVACDLESAADLVPVLAGSLRAVHVIQPIRTWRAERFLEARNPPLKAPDGTLLLDTLQARNLFDLVREPWLFARLIEQAQSGTLPQSRAEVLERIAAEQLAGVDTAGGGKARAPELLASVAWRMASNRSARISFAGACTIADSVRASRGFETENLLASLDRQKLLVGGGDELRFSYSALQKYFAASALARLSDADRIARLDEITATLGRPARVRAWSDVLCLLAGLKKDSACALLERILYGARGDIERLVLAVRVIQESGCTVQALRDRTAAGLKLLTRASIEPREQVRERAVTALAELGGSSTVTHLAEVALDRVRKNFIGDMTFEYSGVRMSAALALMRMGPSAIRQLCGERPAVAATVQLLLKRDFETIDRVFDGKTGEMYSLPVVAFSLAREGSPQGLRALVRALTTRQVDALETLDADARHKAKEMQDDIWWCTAEALTLADSKVVENDVLLARLSELETLPAGVRFPRRQLAHLAGKLASRAPQVRRYLTASMHDPDAALAGRAMKALAATVPEDDGAFTGLLAELTKIAVSAQDNTADALYLRRSALEALAGIGDAATLEALRAPNIAWPEDLELTLFDTSEAIYSRTQEGDQL